ncbi:anti-sigma factor family protein [Burkholderiaceae bacterium UC74_6]
MNDEELSRLLREHASRHPASEALQAAVRTQVALQSAASGPGPAPAPLPSPLPPPLPRRRALLAGMALLTLGLSVGVGLTLGVQRWQSASPDVTAEVVAGHVRALQVGPLFEVASSNRHQVKPWFQGRLDYAPTVLDEIPGFTLLGGRVQTLQGRPTAVLAFQLRLHKIDVFVWPAEHAWTQEHSQLRGFNVVRWSDGAMQYWAVSDLDGAELEKFGEAWRATAQSSR